MADLRRAVELGRTLRSQAGIKVRQPLGTLWLAMPADWPTDETADELTVEWVGQRETLGQLLAGSAQSYACLPETIRMFPLPEELSQRLRAIGCEAVTYRSMTNGIAVAHLGRKMC